MKVFSKVILVLIIVVPIIVCCITLNKINSDSDVGKNYEDVNSNLDSNITSGDDAIDEITNNEDYETSAVMSGEKYTSKIGEPISKLYVDATVAITVANVYEDADETSEIVGTLEKFAVITAHKYPEGWTRVTTGTISGWMRTENIDFPEGGNLDVPEATKTGKVIAEPHLNMRASASTSAEIIMPIPKGATVEIKETSNGWHKVTYASAIGWVSADYVKID